MVSSVRDSDATHESPQGSGDPCAPTNVTLHVAITQSYQQSSMVVTNFFLIRDLLRSRMPLACMHHTGLVKWLGMIWSLDNSRHIPEAIATDPPGTVTGPLQQTDAGYQWHVRLFGTQR
jgi:hypothetical protein